MSLRTGGRPGGVQLALGALADSADYPDSYRAGVWQEVLFPVFWKRPGPRTLPVVRTERWKIGTDVVPRDPIAQVSQICRATRQALGQGGLA